MKIEEEQTQNTVNVSLAAVETTQPIEWHLNKKTRTWGRLLLRSAWILRRINRMKKIKRDPGINLKEIIKFDDKEITIDRIVGEELHEA